jgi:hypothetical protein
MKFMAGKREKEENVKRNLARRDSNKPWDAQKANGQWRMINP